MLAATRPDPAGIARFLPAPATVRAWPSPSFLPVHVAALPNGVFVDWAFVGAPDGTPFGETTVWRALQTPFNRAIRWRMTLDDFVRGAAGAKRPDGLVFHMSHCGSTLTARMFATLPGARAVAEVAAIDTVLQLGQIWPALAQSDHAAILSALLAAYARGPSLIKLDPWHALALPLFHQAAPDVPFVFLYRDPVEVLVSLERSETRLLTGAPPGADPLESLPADERHARLLRKICEAALANEGDGLFVNYNELPQAFEARILPHFGVTQTARDALAKVSREHAKRPGMAFAPDSDAKQREASPHLRALAQEHLAAVYTQLEAMAKT